MRKYLGWLLVATLAACRAQLPTAVAPVQVAPVALPWAATIADRLYERQVLNAAGREALKQRIATHRLRATYAVPSSGNQFADEQVDPATVLAFCVQAFQAEFAYRTTGGRTDSLAGLYIAGQAPDTAAIRAGRQRFARMLQAVHGDTAALFRQLASPGQLLEEKIPAEDSVLQTGWTVFAPFGRLDSLRHPIADSRSVFGKTRTRTARDLYELGLVTQPQYAVLQHELASGELMSELAVCERAAQLALDVAAYPLRRAAFDSLLTRLTQAGVLREAGRQRALADSQVVQQLDLFKLLPYCERAKVLDLRQLPASPRQLYPRLLAEVAGLWPAFRYAAVRTTLVEKRVPEHHYLEQHVTLAFRANDRQYTSSFEEGYRYDQPLPGGATGISEDFVALVNQWLRDQGAAERLYPAYTPDRYSMYGDERRGFILLTAPQRAAWGLSMGLFGSVSEDNTFTSTHIEQSLALYQRLGLLAGLSAAELREGRRQALRGNISSYSQLLRCFPRRLAELGGEDAEEPQAYAKALKQVAQCSRGAFRPVRIHDDFPGEQARKQRSHFAFACGTRQYRATLTSDLGWMDFGFVDLLARAVRENTSGRLYYLGEGDETGEYLFLTPAQAAAIRKVQPDFFREDDENEAASQKKQ